MHTATKAAVDPKDPQRNAARIDAMAAGARLPVKVAADAPLTARLQSWENRPRRPRISSSTCAPPRRFRYQIPPVPTST